MDSIAVLYSLKKDEKPRKIDSNVSGELHINYFKLPLDKGKDYERFLDFGFMINEVAIEIHTIYFYLPFSLSNDDLEDLGECLHKNNFISTLFNDDLNIHSNTHNPSYYTIKPSNSDRDAFWLYILGKDNFKIEEMSNGGSLLSVCIKSLPQNIQGIIEKNESNKRIKRNLYFRFRIKNVSNKNVFFKENLSNDILQSAFSKSEMVDLKINEKRDIDCKVLEELLKGKNMFSFNKIHFFFIASLKEEEVRGYENFKDCRLLNPSRWKDYISGIDIEKHKCIAYHWVKKTENMPFTKFSLFFRTIYKERNWMHIIKYCLVVVVLGLIGSFIASLFYDLCKN